MKAVNTIKLICLFKVIISVLYALNCPNTRKPSYEVNSMATYAEFILLFTPNTKVVLQ